MKIIFLAVRDTGGTAYTITHSINNVVPDEHQAINVRGMNTFVAYPTIVDMADYPRSQLRQMVYASDVIVFLGAMQPFFDALKLKRKLLRDQKKILLCMGSEWRWGRDQLIKQADKLLREYKIVLGGADMFLPMDAPQPDGTTKHFPAVDPNEVGYLPVVRSFDEIQERYGISKNDKVALETFAVPRRKVIFTHAPTNEFNKGSHIFYRAATHAQQVCPQMVFTTVRQQPWISTLGILARSDVLFDQAPPFPTAYGALSVEAAIFHLPSFSQVAPECRDFILRETGLKTPYIAFDDEEDLFKKVVQVASDEKTRRAFGEWNYQYCRQLHDEKPVVQRFLDIVEGM